MALFRLSESLEDQNSAAAAINAGRVTVTHKYLSAVV